MMTSFIVVAGWLVAAAGHNGELPAAFLPLQRSGDLTSAPAIAIEHEAGKVKITFAGVLQSAGAIAGPWTALSNAISPHFPTAAGNQQFYRARDPDSIFSATSVAHFTLIGPFQTHFDLAYAGLPDGIFPPKREKPYFDGMLKLAGFEIPVSLRVRGNSSLQECPFPKLKFKVSREQRAGTPF